MFAPHERFLDLLSALGVVPADEPEAIQRADQPRAGATGLEGRPSPA
jgi:hypothetical protein